MMINNINFLNGAINGAQNARLNSRYTAAKNVQFAQSNLNFTPTPPLSCSLYDTAGVSFRGDVQIHENGRADELYDKYKNSLASNNPLKVMDLLDETDLTPDEVRIFMKNVTGEKETAFAFVEEVTRDEDGTINPSKSPKIVNKLLDKFGTVRNFSRWYDGRDGYVQAFTDYTAEYYNKAQTMEELYAWLPNWDPNTLRNKYQKLTGLQRVPAKEGGYMWPDGYTVGKLPEDLGNIENDKERYRALIGRIVGNIEEHNKINGPAATTMTNIDISEGLEEFGIKSARLVNSGLSPKYKVVLDEKYIVKIDQQKNHNCERDFYNYLDDLRADTAYVNGMINYFIQLYSPEKAPYHYFYDDYTGTNLYEYLPEDTMHFVDENDEEGGKAQCKMLKDEFKHRRKIGVYLRDYNPENFIPTDKRGIVCVDVGKNVYFDLLRPEFADVVSTMRTQIEKGNIEFSDRLKAARAMKDWD